MPTSAKIHTCIFEHTCFEHTWRYFCQQADTIRQPHVNTHTHILTHKSPPRTRQYVPTTCEGTHTAINLPFFSPSFPLSSWEPSAGAFASNPNIDQIPKTPTQTPPVSLSHFLLSHPSFFLLGLCLEERGKRNAGLSEKALAERGSELWGREREENSLVSSRSGIMIVKEPQVPSQMGVGSCSVFKWP